MRTRLFGGDVDCAAGGSRSRRVVRPHGDVIGGAAPQPPDDAGRLIADGPLHAGRVLALAFTPVPQLKKQQGKTARRQNQKGGRHLKRLHAIEAHAGNADG